MGSDQKKIPVYFYKTEIGNEPVREWLKKLNSEEKRLIGEDIKTVEYGWPIGMPTCKPIGHGIYEVRTELPSNKIARVLFCIYDDSMVLLHGFIKKTQKTPKGELELARQRKRKLEA